MPKELDEQYKERIWDENNLDQYGLPNLGVFFKTGAIDFPHDIDANVIMESAEKYVLDKYNSIINSNIIKDFSDLYNMTKQVIEQIEIDDDKAKKLFKVAVDFVTFLCNYRDSNNSFVTMDVAYSLNRVDELVGTIILKSGMASKDKAINNPDIDMIISLLDKAGCPHALLSWCIGEPHSEERYEMITASIFNADISFIKNANQAMAQLICKGIPIDDRFIELMIHSVVSTTSYNVNSYVIGLEHLVRNGMLDDNMTDQLAAALPKLDTITRLDILDDNDVVMRKLAMRKVSSILAKTIFDRLKKQGKSMPRGVLQWMELANNPEEFADIRLVWNE